MLLDLKVEGSLEVGLVSVMNIVFNNLQEYYPGAEQQISLWRSDLQEREKSYHGRGTRVAGLHLGRRDPGGSV